MSDAQRILIVKPSSLGDIVHALPVLAALRRKHPAAHIAWLVGATFEPLLRGHPLIDELIRFDRARYGTMLWNPLAAWAFVRFVRELRRRRFDLVIDLQGLIRSGLISYFSGAPRRVGFADAREGAPLFYTHRVRCDAGARHAVERGLCIARALELECDPPEFPLAIREEERSAARAALASAGLDAGTPFLAVLTGARWESKSWPALRFAELLDRLHRGGAPRAVLLGSPAESAIAAAIAATCREAAPANLAGRTSLRELAAVIELAQRVVCLDSGPMHIAAALNKPTVALFGPTDAARTGPWSRAARVLAHDVPCRPCLKRRCPLGHHACMRDLSAEEVAEAALDACDE